MKIAVTSQNFRTVTPHAGRTRRFLVYEVAADEEPTAAGRLDLPQEMVIHDFRGDGPHPLDAMDLIIAGSFGEGFATRMAARGIPVIATNLIDPLAAVKEYVIRKRLGEGMCGGSGACGAGHAHGHGHGHGHGHAGERNVSAREAGDE